MKKHVSLRLAKALSMDDWILYELFGVNPEELCEDFRARIAAGEVFIAVEYCEGFDPVKGCPGHSSETDSITKQ